MMKYERMTTLRFMALGDHRDNAKTIITVLTPKQR